LAELFKNTKIKADHMSVNLILRDVKFTFSAVTCVRYVLYSPLLRFRPVEEIAELANGPTGRGGVARNGCLFAWNLRVTRSTVLTETATRTRRNMMLSLH
jgi:hypothetical protein